MTLATAKTAASEMPHGMDCFLSINYLLLDRETVEARCLPHLPTHPVRILCEWEYVEGILLQ
jgi:hypothetical protein